MATAKGQFEIDPLDGDAVNYQAQGASGGVRAVAHRDGAQILIDLVNGADNVRITFHSREELNDFVQLLQSFRNI